MENEENFIKYEAKIQSVLLRLDKCICIDSNNGGKPRQDYKKEIIFVSLNTVSKASL